MKNLFVKICGITRAQDAELAANLGASAIGFVFWPDSPRYVHARTVTAMTANVSPSVLKVGVFVDQPIADVARMIDEAGLDVAQLHGHESPDYCRQLMIRLTPDTTDMKIPVVGTAVVSGSSRTIFKAVALAGNGSIDVDDFDPDVVFLVDAHDPVRFGGTGKTVSWESAREIAATRRTILAGGLNAANIKLAVRSVRPYGVDVSSGVESAPGVKDPNRLRTFFEALHD
ncbi:MAG TPA: phosphoribosylanthranilate isomerase [Vicinamibacterales bacterium]